jgi:hypothetical protein
VKRMPRPLSESRKPESRRKTAVLRVLRLRLIDSPPGFPGQPCRLRGREGRGMAGEARGRDDIAGPPDPGAAALAMRDQHRLAEARGDRRGGVAHMPPTAVPSTHLGVRPR